MDRFVRFYGTVAGRVVVGTAAGMLVGGFIYLLRGASMAPFICGAASGCMAWLQLPARRKK